MARPRPRLRPLCAAMVGAFAIVAFPSATAASGETQILPGESLAAGAADIDGDGVREIVRLVAAPSEVVLLEVWREAAGAWAPVDSVPFVVPDDIGNATLSDRSLRAGALLHARRGAADSMLAVTAEAIPGDAVGRTCCLTVAEVVLGDAASIELRPLAVTGIDRGASVVQAVDLDGDGTDELVTMVTDTAPDGDIAETGIGVMARTGDGFAAVSEIEAPRGLYGLLEGETNGVPGDDLVGRTDSGTIVRVAMVDGRVVLEADDSFSAGPSVGPTAGPIEGWIAGIAGGRIVITGGSVDSVLRWPNGAPPEEAARLGTGGSPATVVGSGPDALILYHDGDPRRPGAVSPLDVYDLELHQLEDDLAGAPATDAVWSLLGRQAGSGPTGDPPRFPYVGPLPSGRWAPAGGYAHSGVLIGPDGRGGYERGSISSLTGLYPVTSAGRDEAWLIAARGFAVGAGRVAYLSPGQMEWIGPGQLMAIPAEKLHPGEADGHQVTVDLQGDVVELSGDGDARLVAAVSGFSVAVDAPSGSVVVHGGVGRRSGEVEVTDSPVQIPMGPPRASADEDSDFDAWLAVVTPSGAVATRSWSGRFVADAPAVEASAATSTFALQARVSGRASTDASVTVDGLPVRVGPDGTFEVSVDAPPWPSGVVVVARDPLGNETATRLEVVGFLDYRRLPWLPLAGVVTVLIGGYAVLRLPRRPEARVHRDDDAVLEDFDDG